MTEELAVVGLGIVSPLGVGVETHAFLMRAGQGPCAPGGFVTETGDGIAVYACPFLPIDRPWPERLGLLGAHAVADAYGLLAGCIRPPVVAAWIVTPDREGPAAELALRDAVRAHAARPRLLAGGAGLCTALLEARDALERRDVDLGMVLVADSLVERARIAEHQALAQNPWGPNLLEPSEGAVALLVATPSAAAELGLEAWAQILHCEVEADDATDDNEAPIRADALTRLFRAVQERAHGPIRVAFGPTRLDGLRRREWDMAQARTAAMWDPALAIGCAEQELGVVGELSTALNLALLLACLRHGTMPDATEPSPPSAAACLAWGIDRSGRRSVALVVSDAPRSVAARVIRRPTAAARPTRLMPNPAPLAEGGALAEGPRRLPDDTSPQEAATAAPLPPDPRLPTLEGSSHAVLFDAAAHASSTLTELAAGQIADGVDRIAMLGRHRLERSTAELGEATARLLAVLDALAVLGASSTRLLDCAEQAGMTDVWVPAAVALALVTLDRPDSGAALLELTGALPASDEVVRVVGHALGWSPLADPACRADELLRSARDVERALGLELAARFGLLAPERLEERLARGAPLELCAGARACARLARSKVTGPMRATLRARLGELGRTTDTPDATAARAGYECARALLVQGDRGPLEALRAEPSLALALGELAPRLIAMGGNLCDVTLLESWLARLPSSEMLLDAVGRLGHPGSWAYLVHFLDDPEAADGADRALRTLFGPALAETDGVTRPSWVAAIAALQVAPEIRLRSGAPWSPAALVAECSSGRRSLAEIALVVDELRVHGAPIPEQLAALADAV